MKIVPRNDFCVVRAVKIDLTKGGLAMPDSAVQGYDHIIVAVGPKVEDCKPGDKVMITGKHGVDYAFIPSCKDLFVIRQDNVVLVFEEEK